MVQEFLPKISQEEKEEINVETQQKKYEEKKRKILEDLRVKNWPELDSIIVATIPPPDEWIKDIVGIVHMKVPYVGYPTLWIRSLFSQ